GTTTKPPPFPNNPAVIPAIAPAIHNVATNNNSSTSITPLRNISKIGIQKKALYRI
ncbi:MAG: hypothetical protein ACI936_003309, partial [Paraglaciecola sp.]